MSVTITHQNLFDADADAIVITVNCGGIMGKGVAEGFKRKWPMQYMDYRKRCKGGLLTVGRISNEDCYQIGNGRYAILMPTKSIWQRNSQVSWIETGLADLLGHCCRLSLDSIAIPPPGCGNGGLDFEKEVKPLIVDMFDGEDVDVTVCIQ